MEDGITAIIPAAGTNTRLRDVVPPGLKPLLLINGRPLIQHAVNHALDAWGADEVVIIVSPDNARAITSVIDGQWNFIVQPEPDGIVDAIRRALPFVKTRHTLILCADNTFEGRVVKPTADGQCIAVRRDLPWAEAQRFTHVRMCTPPSELCKVIQQDKDWNTVWIGPLVVLTDRLTKALEECDDDLIAVLQHVGPFTPLEMKCSDLGIPEAL